MVVGNIGSSDYKMGIKECTEGLTGIYNRLLRHYGPQGWWPLYNNKAERIEYHPNDYSFPKNEEQSFEIIIGAILTQNTSWKNVEKAMEELRKNNALSKAKLEALSTEKIAMLIRSSGYHNQKSRKIKEYMRFNKEVTRESLLQVWGIGPETADSILLYAYKQPVFVIDAYTKRIMERIGLSFKSYNDLQKTFMDNLPRDHKVYNEFHALLVELGKNVCKKEPVCNKCPLALSCGYNNR